MSDDHHLPLDVVARSRELARRSTPSPDAPPTNLPPDIDYIIRERDRARASFYASLEDAADRCGRLADSISESGIVVAVDDDDADSLVTHLDDLARVGAVAAR